MQFDLIKRIREESGNQLQWQVSYRGFPATRPDVLVEKFLWLDVSGSLAVSFVDKPGAGYFRLYQDNQIYVDVLPRNQLVVRSDEDVQESTVEHFLADQVIPRAIAQSGKLVLHAGGVRNGDGAILFMGKSGQGKSTLTASFDSSGLALMGDDAMVISSCAGTHFAQSVYPSLRLFQDSVSALLPERIETSSVSNLSDKRRIDIPVESNLGGKKLPISAIISIGPTSVSDDVSSRTMSIAETCMGLVENSFLLDPTDMVRVARNLSAASEIARRVPSFEISYPRDYSRLPEVRNIVLKQLKQLS